MLNRELHSPIKIFFIFPYTSNVTAAETTDVENRQFGDSAETESAKSPVDQNNDGDVESDDDLDEEDEDEDDDDDEKMDDPYTFSDDEKETIPPPNPTIPGKYTYCEFLREFNTSSNFFSVKLSLQIEEQNRKIVKKFKVEK